MMSTCLYLMCIERLQSMQIDQVELNGGSLKST